jgi:hypothetical protein
MYHLLSKLRFQFLLPAYSLSNPFFTKIVPNQSFKNVDFFQASPFFENPTQGDGWSQKWPEYWSQG